MQVYIVVGDMVEFDYFQHWAVKAYTDKNKADAHCNHLNELLHKFAKDSDYAKKIADDPMGDDAISTNWCICDINYHVVSTEIDMT